MQIEITYTSADVGKSTKTYAEEMYWLLKQITPKAIILELGRIIEDRNKPMTNEQYY